MFVVYENVVVYLVLSYSEFQEFYVLFGGYIWNYII